MKFKFIIINIAILIFFSTNLYSQDYSKLKLNETITVKHEPYDWETSSPESFNINIDTLNAFFNKISEWENLTGVLIIKDDKLILEKYYKGHNMYSAYNTTSPEMRGVWRSDKVLLSSFSFNGLTKWSSGNPHYWYV